MSDIAINVENLGKQYEIGELVTFRDLPRLVRYGVTAPYRMLTGKKGQGRGSGLRRERFWALKDINFQIKHGEVLGVIGRNGAGKSTLLKILARITAPTVGRADLFGRIGSLLGVGTGFHPELTGRENIYLSGAILGMTRVEIKARFDEIIDFAGIGKFIDTPIKRYSAGMVVRLGFAVAAHLTPEILIIDEVLAVGDFEFQKKCLGKMQEITEEEQRTIILVSHNMASISSLCDKTLLLQEGSLVMLDKTEVVIRRYLDEFNQASARPLLERTDREGSGEVRCLDLRLENDQGERVGVIQAGAPLTVCLEYEFRDGVVPCHFNFTIHSGGSGISLAQVSSARDRDFSGYLPSRGTLRCRIASLPFNQGHYFITSSLVHPYTHTRYDHVEAACLFTIEASDFHGSGKLPASGISPVLLDYSWRK